MFSISLDSCEVKENTEAAGLFSFISSHFIMLTASLGFEA